MAELKPCPFCGKHVSIKESSDRNGYVICHNSVFDPCILHLPILIEGLGKMDCIDLWNRIELAKAESGGRLIVLPSDPYEMADVAQEILSRACKLQRGAEAEVNKQAE